MTANGHMVSLRVTKMSKIALLYTKKHRSAYFKLVNCVAYELYVNKAV